MGFITQYADDGVVRTILNLKEEKPQVMSIETRISRKRNTTKI